MGHSDYMSAGHTSESAYVHNSLMINSHRKTGFDNQQVWSDSQWMKCATAEKGISSEKRKLLTSSSVNNDCKTLPCQSSPENEYACIDEGGLRNNFESNFVKNKKRESCKSMSTFSGFIPTLSSGLGNLEPEPYATTDLLLSNRNSTNNGSNTNGPIYSTVS